MTSWRVGVTHLWKLMPQPLASANGGESSSIRYALPSSSKSTHTSEVMYSSPKSPPGRGSLLSSAPVPALAGSSAG
jgi:hypothetical protein